MKSHFVSFKNCRGNLSNEFFLFSIKIMHIPLFHSIESLILVHSNPLFQIYYHLQWPQRDRYFTVRALRP